MILLLEDGAGLNIAAPKYSLNHVSNLETFRRPRALRRFFDLIIIVIATRCISFSHAKLVILELLLLSFVLSCNVRGLKPNKTFMIMFV